MKLGQTQPSLLYYNILVTKR